MIIAAQYGSEQQHFRAVKTQYFRTAQLMINSENIILEQILIHIIDRIFRQFILYNTYKFLEMLPVTD